MRSQGSNDTYESGISALPTLSDPRHPYCLHAVSDWRRVRAGLTLQFMSLTALVAGSIALAILDGITNARLLNGTIVRELLMLFGIGIVAALLAGHSLCCAIPTTPGDRTGRAFAIAAIGCLSLALVTLTLAWIAGGSADFSQLFGVQLDRIVIGLGYLGAFLLWAWHALALLFLERVARSLGQRQLQISIAGFVAIFAFFSLAALVAAFTSTPGLLCSLPVALFWYLPLLHRVQAAIGDAL
jgi:hypothetical protein